jgi:hypothetical protein
MREHKSRMWNSVELHKLYVYGGTLSRRFLVRSVEQALSPDLLVLSSPGVASILVFRSNASEHLRIEDDAQNDCLSESINCLAAVIKSECPRGDGKHYRTRITHHIASPNI